MRKPILALNELDREPIVQFGCTWSEIQRCIRQASLVVLPLTLIAMLSLRFAAIWFAVGLLAWLGLTRFLIYTLQRARSGKPLYYEHHRKAIHRLGAPFVRAGQIYQSQRTHRLTRRPR